MRRVSDPSCSEIEVIIRDFESGPGVFADDGAFAFGSGRDIELGARVLYDHCVRWGMMPYTFFFGKYVTITSPLKRHLATRTLSMTNHECPGG